MSEFPGLDELSRNIESGKVRRQNAMTGVLLAVSLLFIAGVAALALFYFYAWRYV